MPPTYRFAVNPRWDDLPRMSAVVATPLSGDYHVPAYRTTLSLKSVARGRATYATRRSRYVLDPGALVVLNQDQEYTLDIDARDRTATVCLFFEPGLVEGVVSAMQAPEGALLEPEGVARGGGLEICERLHPKSGDIGARLQEIERRIGRDAGEPLDPAWLEAQMFGIASAIARLEGRVRGEMASFPGLRAATRVEAYRRLHWARDFLDASFAEPLTVARIARVAAMSPFHFQRLFRQAFGETPMQRVQARRLRAAASLLQDTERPITRICLDVGFESLGTFSALFRRRFGASPSAFRQMRRIEEAGVRARP
jgi:AraC family transcriptional regulator